MAQRQFRSDDTSPWLYGFGDGSDGTLTISGDTTEAPIDSSCTGTSGTNTLTVGSGLSFAAGQLVLIIQTMGGFGSAVVTQWELNKVSGYTSTTLTLANNLVNEYSTSLPSRAAQVRVLKQYTNVTINSGITYTAKAFDDTTGVGGILAFFANGTTTVTGNISATGKGFQGGASTFGGGATASSGEGTSGPSTAQQSANGNGGGGGAGGIGGGGGGGNGASGSTAAGGGSAGVGGDTVGNAGLTLISLGGGGGGGVGAIGSQTGSTTAGTGGGIIMIFSKNITVSGTVVALGTQASGEMGESGSVRKITAGSGAGGSILYKGQVLTLGSSLTTATGAAQLVASGSEPFSGGAGGTGRVHADYLVSISGTTSPSIDSRQDASLVDNAGGGGLVMFLF